VRDLVHDCYVADKGRPSVDPLVFFRLELDSVGKWRLGWRASCV
jgi:hypothetical protein